MASVFGLRRIPTPVRSSRICCPTYLKLCAVNELLGIWRKAHPENKKLPADLDFPPNPKIELQGNEFSEKLLQKWAGRSFYPKEETFLVNLHDA
jgi:hypothetical protein